MATQQAQDDGLIILSDDTSVSFDTQSPVVPTENNNLIHLDLPIVTAPTVSISVPETTSPAPSSEFSFDFNLTPAPLTEAVAQEEIKSPTTPIVDVTPVDNTSLTSPIVQEVTTPKISSEDDMDSILEGTIAKLRSRQLVIDSTKEKKNTRIAELSHDIEELQNQVTDLKEDVTDLIDEHTKIEANVKSLESMKMFEKAQEEEKVREHNLKKVSAK